MRAKFRNCRENSFAFEENFVYYTKELSRVFMKFNDSVYTIRLYDRKSENPLKYFSSPRAFESELFQHRV